MKTYWFIILLILFFLIDFFIHQYYLFPKTITDSEFKCCDSNASSRAYVLVSGLGFTTNTLDYFDSLINDPKKKSVLKFDYGDHESLKSISESFTNEFNEFASSLEVDELIIIGYSAGGLIASYSLPELEYNSSIILHTIASPLGGCYDNLLIHEPGIIGDIGKRVSFTKPSINFQVIHHKTITDQVLSQWCGSLIIQDNNVPGSKEYYYENLSHQGLMIHVTQQISTCFYPNQTS